MQIKILDRDFYKSASYLRCPQELNAQIYEATHGLASMLDCVDDLDLSDKCKKQIKKYKDYPQCKLWERYERHLYNYILWHFTAWYQHYPKSNPIVNEINIKIIGDKYFNGEGRFIVKGVIPNWITDEVIQIHRSVLIQKEIEREKKLKIEFSMLNSKLIYKSINEIDYNKKMESVKSKLLKNHHYRNLWPDCPRDLKMRYDWRKNIQ